MSTKRYDIFCHFFDKEIGELLFDSFNGKVADSYLTMRSAYCVSILLCRDTTYVAPAFFVENPFVRDVVDELGLVFERTNTYFPLRESSIGDFIEKKRRQYSSIRGKYAHIFDEDVATRLDKYSNRCIARQTSVSTYISSDIVLYFDKLLRDRIFSESEMRMSDVNIVRYRAKALIESDMPVVWENYKDFVEDTSIRRFLKRAINIAYVKSYEFEYGCKTLHGGKIGHPDINLKSPRYLRYDLFLLFLKEIGLENIILCPDPELIVQLRDDSNFSAIVEEYIKIATDSESRSQFLSSVGSAMREGRIPYVKYSAIAPISLDGKNNTKLSIVEYSKLQNILEGFFLEDCSTRAKMTIDQLKSARKGKGYSMSEKNRTVFLVHGRDERARASLVGFLRALGLFPMEFAEARSRVEEAAPHIDAIIEAAMAECQAVIVLFTPDENVSLKTSLQADESDRGRRLQARPNVFYEAGYARAKYPNRTILVTMGNTYIPSDILGRFVHRLSSSAKSRNDLKSTLENCGLDVRSSGSDWLDVEIEHTK